MIEFIQGKLVEKNPAYAIIECNGLGYLIQISLNTYSGIEENTSCKLHTYYNVSVDVRSGASNHKLFGFSTLQERQIFKELISVSGVSTNLAMVILSSANAKELSSAIINGNIDMFKSVKGIGPKLAQRIVLDLQSKFQKSDEVPEISVSISNTMRNDALIALCSLGFNRSKAEQTIQKIINQNSEELQVEELIKESLKVL